MPVLEVQYVAADGCYFYNGIRLRAAPGNGEGSLDDEIARGVRTPLADRTALADCLGCVLSAEKKAFLRSLPVARRVRRGT